MSNKQRKPKVEPAHLREILAPTEPQDLNESQVEANRVQALTSLPDLGEVDMEDVEQLQRDYSVLRITHKATRRRFHALAEEYVKVRQQLEQYRVKAAEHGVDLDG